jgi:hypothetical protein
MNDHSAVPSVLEQKDVDVSGVASETQSTSEKPDEMEKVGEKPAESKDDASSASEEVEYPTAWKLAFITIALCLAVFCMALDNTIIATAIPRITDQFKALDDVGWYGSAYLLTTCECP